MLKAVAEESDSAVERDAQRVRELLASRRYDEALQVADARLTEVSENRDLLYLKALSQRHLGQVPQALATLDVLERKHPGFSRLHEERGHCYAALRDGPRAIDALQ